MQRHTCSEGLRSRINSQLYALIWSRPVRPARAGVHLTALSPLVLKVPREGVQVPFILTPMGESRVCPKRIEVASDFPPPMEIQHILSLTWYYTEMSPCKKETCRLRNKFISSRLRLPFTDWVQILTSNVTDISKKHNTHLSTYYGK